MGKRGPGARPVKGQATTPARRTRRLPRGGTRVDRLIVWIETLKITSGLHAGRRFILRPWQRDILAAIYRTDDDGRRIVRQALITLGRKNGKTQLAAALALAHLAGPEAEERGQVYSGAVDRRQAALIYREMRAFILSDAELNDRIIMRDFHKEMEDTKTGSIYAALSSDARAAHGLSPSFYVIDELAQMPDRSLLDTLETGGGARAEPLGIIISTQSADPASPMSQLVHYAEQVRNGIVIDPAFSGHIFTLPITYDPFDANLWHLANPALGDFLSLADMQTAAGQAQRIPAREAVFRNLRLNQPIEADERFIHARDWDALGEPFDPAELRGKRCVAGLDLGGAGDLSGLALWFPDDDRLLCWGFIPDLQLDAKAHTDRAPYRQWAAEGYLIPTPGRSTDKRWIAHKLREIATDYRLEAVAFDRWAFADLLVICDGEGIRLPFQPHGQGYKDMGPSTEEFERLVLNGRLHHGGNPVLRWCLSNVAVTTDPTGARKPAKDRAKGRIDLAVSVIMAVGHAARMPAPAAYSFTGLLPV